MKIREEETWYTLIEEKGRTFLCEHNLLFVSSHVVEHHETRERELTRVWFECLFVVLLHDGSRRGRKEIQNKKRAGF